MVSLPPPIHNPQTVIILMQVRYFTIQSLPESTYKTFLNTLKATAFMVPDCHARDLPKPRLHAGCNQYMRHIESSNYEKA